jgi:hypothetical protein
MTLPFPESRISLLVAVRVVGEARVRDGGVVGRVVQFCHHELGLHFAILVPEDLDVRGLPETQRTHVAAFHLFALLDDDVGLAILVCGIDVLEDDPPVVTEAAHRNPLSEFGTAVRRNERSSHLDCFVNLTILSTTCQ